MWPILGILIAGGIYEGWVSVPTVERVPTVAELRVGARVHVMDVHGKSVSGAIGTVSSGAVTIDREGLAVTVAAEDVQTVWRQDSVVNGALLGSAGGLVGAALYGRNVCGDDAAECAVTALAVGVGGGVAIGIVVDAFMHATLYSRADGLQLRVGPVVSEEGIGAGLSMGW